MKPYNRNFNPPWKNDYIPMIVLDHLEFIDVSEDEMSELREHRGAYFDPNGIIQIQLANL